MPVYIGPLTLQATQKGAELPVWVVVPIATLMLVGFCVCCLYIAERFWRP